jgi:hypothetical protein
MDDVRSPVKVTVDEGVILVSSVWVKVTESVIIVMVDTKSKYPTIGATSSVEVYLGATEQTMHRGEKQDMTRVSLDLPEGFAVRVAECGRYDVHIICYPIKLLEEADLAWERKGG